MAKKKTKGGKRSGAAKAPKAVARKTTKKKAAPSKRKSASRSKPAKPRTRDSKSTAHSPRASAPRRAAVAAQAPSQADASTKKRPALAQKDLQRFRELLVLKRAQLIGDVNTLREEARSRHEVGGELSNVPYHMADLGSDFFEQELTLGLLEGERALLNEIEEALDRIDRGVYGTCLATGAPIGKARLNAKPWAKYCYEYMLAQERGGRRI